MAREMCDMANWLRIKKNYPTKRFPYTVMAKDFMLSVHRTKLGAEAMKMRLSRRFSNSKEAISALVARNYRPFNQ